MTNRVTIIIVLCILSAGGYLLTLGVSNATGTIPTQVKRRTQTQRSKRLPVQRTTRIDYSRFTHRSEKHKGLACNACHKAPTANWVAASSFPDVADYPSHDACTGCHRAQFFKGARPPICSVCHTKVSPRARERFDFEKPDQPSQFTIIFPHDKHQDVIASDRRRPQLTSAHAVRRISFVQDKSNYNNCTICHATETRALNPQGGFPDNFLPPTGTFKSAPAGHGSCFNCHWKSQEPTREACAGCHSLSQTDIAMILEPSRKSLKFNHEREQHLAECTVCHINITREASLIGLKPDVPITSCSSSSCHGARPDRTVVTIETEVDRRSADANFVCSKCHTSDVGKRASPASHRAALLE
jgi:hypothetical protein